MEIQRLYPAYRSIPIAAAIVAGFLLYLGTVDVLHAQTTSISGPAYQLLSRRVVANQSSYSIYIDQDSGSNHGSPSGFFAGPGNLETIHIDTGCVDSSTSPNGCSTDPLALDRVRGTVMRISFDPQAAGNYAGINIEEPERWGTYHTDRGYDLRGANNVIFDVRSPNGGTVQFGVGGCTTTFMTIPSTWTTKTVALSALSCTPDLADVHILFSVATDSVHAPDGATVLLDNIRFDPVPTSHQSAIGFPLSNQTFGVVPQQTAPIPSDQMLRNLTTIYESSLTELTLLTRGTPQDLANARVIADSFDYALHHDNHGDLLPVAPDGSPGLHNGYEDGDIAFFNGQQPPRQGQAGDARLAGFTATTLCAPSGFCLVLDGATGGNNAFAILALVAAFKQFRDVRYLNDAVIMGKWIIGNLTDHSGTGYGGYFLGYDDRGIPPPKPLQTGKSIENNADIFAAFTALADVESQIGDSSAAASWTDAANVAGDFVLQMFDSSTGRFNAGTVPAGTAPAPGICPNGSQRGEDVINTCDFLDSNTFTTLAMAGAPRYQNQIDWRRPIQYVLANFAQTVSAGGRTFKGFNIVVTPVSGPNGIAWEFTGQTVQAMRYVDKLYSDNQFESYADSYLAQIGQAQTLAPFGDGEGLVASTLEGGDELPPVQQCLNTPFQCIAERVGLAATTWSILAEQNLNIFTVSLNPSTLWLNNSRFKVEVDWQTPGGSAGIGTPVTLTTDSGYFWFFRSSNVELLVKILDGRGVNGHFWVFYGAMTDVQYLITITDTVTGAVRTYQGQQGVQKSGNDINAFTDSAPSGITTALDPVKEGRTFQALLRSLDKRASVSGSTAAEGDTALYLNNNRFRVEVNWSDLAGTNGAGTAVPLTSDSGYFWFFSGGNVELMVKVLDGRGTNNHFWVFYGALTDIQYTITVTDTQTGAVKTYQGQQGIQKSGYDLNAF